MERKRVATAAPWAQRVGYSRAVRAGGIVAVSGTAAVGEDGRIVHAGDAYAQARRCCEIIVGALRELGAAPSDVIRTRIYIREGVRWDDVGRAHGEFFAAAPPATTMVVTGFIDPAMLVEIEADAVLPS
jgi:enamine deaminase RidA (YjgF/YER057c/UK114 family)